MPKQSERMTIEEIEALLRDDEEPLIAINPDGTITRLDGKPSSRPPLTKQHYMGEEY